MPSPSSRKQTRPLKLRPKPSPSFAANILQQALMLANITPPQHFTPSPPLLDTFFFDLPTTSSAPSSPTNTSAAPPPLPISPLATPPKATPPRARTLSSSSTSSSLPSITPSLPSTARSPSENFKRLMAKRRSSMRAATQCTYIFKKGNRKGDRCHSSSILDEVMCGTHLKQKCRINTSSPSVPKPKVSIKLGHLRINRLKRNKKYFFVKLLGKTKVVVKCEGKSYILKLPYELENPIKPCKNFDYLIRRDKEKTKWETVQ